MGSVTSTLIGSRITTEAVQLATRRMDRLRAGRRARPRRPARPRHFVSSSGHHQCGSRPRGWFPLAVFSGECSSSPRPLGGGPDGGHPGHHDQLPDMNTRRGFTLVELLIVMVMLTLVGGALSRVLVNSMRVRRPDGPGRHAVQCAEYRLVLPLELREIGYDSNITTKVVTSDLELINASYVQFRAGRGFSSTCGTPSSPRWRIRKPVYGMRQPAITDGFMLYVENDPNTGIDDQWIPLVVTAIDYDGLCGTDSAIVLTISHPRSIDPGLTCPFQRFSWAARFDTTKDAVRELATWMPMAAASGRAPSRRGEARVSRGGRPDCSRGHRAPLPVLLPECSRARPSRANPVVGALHRSPDHGVDALPRRPWRARSRGPPGACSPGPAWHSGIRCVTNLAPEEWMRFAKLRKDEQGMA